MTLMRGWTPNGTLLNAEDEMHRLLHDLVRGGESPGLAPAGWIPPVDVHETDTGYTLQIDLPAVNPKDVKIELVEGRLSIRGERKLETGDGTVARRLERAAGAFERAFRLKARVAPDAIKATYKDGVLRIDVPKAPEAVRREIAIDLG
jgi:HSP20 family protein